MWVAAIDRASNFAFQHFFYWFIPLYAVSFFGLVSFYWKLPFSSSLRRFNAILGAYQRFLSPLRFLLTGFFVLWFAWSASQLFLHCSWQGFLPLAAFFLIWLLEFFTQLLWRKRKIQLLEELLQYQLVDPTLFYRALLEVRSVWSVQQYLTAASFEKIDFRDAPKRCVVRVWWKGFILTYRTVRLAFFYEQQKGREALRQLSAPLACVWSLAVLKLIRANVVFSGEKHLSVFSSSPHKIYSFTHQSLFDFVLAPLMCLFARSPEGKLGDLPCFLMAKDHFFDNFFVRRVLGLGKVVESLGMIFVERKERNAVTTGRAIEQAVDVLWRGVPLGIFPQGTRSWPQYDAKGKRLGASYFVVGSVARMQRPFSHLKPGLARMVLGCLKRAQQDFSHTMVSVLPIVFAGAAKLLPKRAMHIQAGETVEIRVAEPLLFHHTILRASDSQILFDIQQKLDRAYIQLLRLEADFERRFLEFVGKQQDMLKLEAVSAAFKAARGADPTLYMILDAIYTCNSRQWSAMQAQLAEKIVEVVNHDELILFYQNVVACIEKS